MAWFGTLLAMTKGAGGDLLTDAERALAAVDALRAGGETPPATPSAPISRFVVTAGQPAESARIIERFEAARTARRAGDPAAIERLDALWLDIDALARDRWLARTRRRRRQKTVALVIVAAATVFTLWLRRPHPPKLASVDVVGAVPYQHADGTLDVHPEWRDEHLRRVAETYFGHRQPGPRDLLVGMTAINPSSASSNEAGRVDVEARLESLSAVPYAALPVDAMLTLTMGRLVPDLDVGGIGPALDVKVRLTHGADLDATVDIDEVAPRSRHRLQSIVYRARGWRVLEVDDTRRGKLYARGYVRLAGPVEGLETIQVTPLVMLKDCRHAGEAALGTWARISTVDALRRVPGGRVLWRFEAEMTARGTDLRGRAIDAKWRGTTGPDAVLLRGIEWQRDHPCGPLTDADGAGAGAGDLVDPSEVEDAMERAAWLGDHPGSAKTAVIDVKLDLNGGAVEPGRAIVASDWVRDRLAPGGHLRVATAFNQPRGGLWTFTWRMGGRVIGEQRIVVPAALHESIRYANDGPKKARARFAAEP